MIGSILQFKNMIIVGAIAFAIGGGIGAATSYNLTANYKDAQQVAALAKQKGEYEEKIAQTNEQNGKINTYQADTIIGLMAEKETILKERNDKVSTLQASARDLSERNRAGSGGGVFYDPHATPAKPAACPATVPGSAAAATIEPADTTGRLSRETSQNLIDFATDAEMTRLDLIAQVQYADALERQYSELIKRIDEVTRTRKTSSHQ